MSHLCTYGSCITIVLSAYAVNVYPSDCHSSLNLWGHKLIFKEFFLNFLCQKIFYCSFSFITCDWSVFNPGSVLEGCTFLRIGPFIQHSRGAQLSASWWPRGLAWGEGGLSRREHMYPYGWFTCTAKSFTQHCKETILHFSKETFFPFSFQKTSVLFYSMDFQHSRSCLWIKDLKAQGWGGVKGKQHC